jgi:RHS repeat-associated protein
VYDANGTELSQSAVGNRYTFQGRVIDWDTGLYNFRARWYDPDTGRWLSKDPIGIEGGLNQYVAFNNNPVNYVDPLGMWGTLARIVLIFILRFWPAHPTNPDDPYNPTPKPPKPLNPPKPKKE